MFMTDIGIGFITLGAAISLVIFSWMIIEMTIKKPKHLAILVALLLLCYYLGHYLRVWGETH